MSTEFKLDGVKQALKNLDQFSDEFGGKESLKVMSAALSRATTPTTRQIRLAAPVGSVPHRDYRGMLVAPGHLKRSVRKRVKRTRDGNPSSIIGVRAEAFYGVQFLPIGVAGTGRTTPKDWFEGVFERNVPAMTRSFAQFLGPQMERAAKRLKARR